MADGLPLPERIKNAPSLHFGLELYYSAFWELSTCRPQPHMPIPWLAMRQYADSEGIAPDVFEDFVPILRMVDDWYLNWQHQRTKQD